METAAVVAVPSGVPSGVPGKPASGLLGLSHHPKTGERRRVRQPLRLDRLPLAIVEASS